MGSLSPPPCFLKQGGPGLSRASCKALSRWLDRAVCNCWVVLGNPSGGVAYPGLSSSFPLPSCSSMLSSSSLGVGVSVGSVYFPFAAVTCTASSSEVESPLYWGGWRVVRCSSVWPSGRTFSMEPSPCHERGCFSLLSVEA